MHEKDKKVPANICRVFRELIKQREVWKKKKKVEYRHGTNYRKHPTSSPELFPPGFLN